MEQKNQDLNKLDNNEAAMLIKGRHRQGSKLYYNDEPQDLHKLDVYSKPLSEQVPKQKPATLPAAVHQGPLIVPLSGANMQEKTDAELDAIVAGGLEALPTQPTSSDYVRFAATREARKEQLRRAMRPGAPGMMLISPTSAP